ncbi:hypothetical protein EVAR_16037_1 [Eumeta japonica]|uniref:Uncharacterized protein n=1 Tax=Eumeta variegata TaxID=151549 RepID=A0A4C1VXD8_EUMVA|nr:hypothetical protein EVAR_16037_1 [Eumeta japonica]
MTLTGDDSLLYVDAICKRTQGAKFLYDRLKGFGPQAGPLMGKHPRRMDVSRGTRFTRISCSRGSSQTVLLAAATAFSHPNELPSEGFGTTTTRFGKLYKRLMRIIHCYLRLAYHASKKNQNLDDTKISSIDPTLTIAMPKY